MINILGFILCIPILLFDIPAIKNGELIVVDNVLENTYEIQSSELNPYVLNIIQLKMNESIKASEQRIDWELKINDESKPFIVGMGGNHIGFVFTNANTIYVSANIQSKYNFKEVDYIKNEIGTYERIEKDREILDIKTIDKEFNISPQPDPEPNPDPKPDPRQNLSEYGKFAYDAYYLYVHNTGFNKEKLIDSAHKQAAGLKVITTKIAAGVILNVPTLLQEVVDSNKKAYLDAGVDPKLWDEFGLYFQELLWKEYQDGKLQTLEAYKPLLDGIAEGLEVVK